MAEVRGIKQHPNRVMLVIGEREPLAEVSTRGGHCWWTRGAS